VRKKLVQNDVWCVSEQAGVKNGGPPRRGLAQESRAMSRDAETTYESS